MLTALNSQRVLGGLVLEAGRQRRDRGTEGIKADEFKSSTVGLMYLVVYNCEVPAST